MQVAIRKMGNSQGILIPKPILDQLEMSGSADLQVINGVIEIRPIKINPRATWAKDSQKLAKDGSDSLIWPEFGNEGDTELAW